MRGDRYRKTYRTTEYAVLVPGASRIYNRYVNTGPTRNYGRSSPSGPNNTLDSRPLNPDNLYTSEYVGSDEDPTGFDCYLWNRKDQGDLTGMLPMDFHLVPTFGSSPSIDTLSLTGSGTNPLEPLSPPIVWDIKVQIQNYNPTGSTANPFARVTGSHTCYPAHTLKVNNTVIYDSQDYGFPLHNNFWYLAACLSHKLLEVPVSTPYVSVNVK